MAARAGVSPSTTAVNPEIWAVAARGAVAVDERREGRAPPLDAFSQDGPNSPVQADDFIEAELVSASFGVDAGPEQGFVGVDIAETSDERLVEDGTLDLRGSALQGGIEPRGGEIARQRFRAKAPVQCLDDILIDVKDAAELALVGKPEVPSVVEVEGEVLESERRIAAFDKLHLAGHPEMDNERGAVVQWEDEVLATPSDVDHGTTNEVGGGPGGGVPKDARKRLELDVGNGPAEELVADGAADCFDFREFRHTMVRDRWAYEVCGDDSEIVSRTVVRTGMAAASNGNEDCIFCRIARGEVTTEFVAETSQAVAFNDLHPAAPVHILVAPRRHITSLRELRDPVLAGDLLLFAARVARGAGLHEGGYRIVANDGADAGQTVHHLHFHVLGGHPLQTALG